VLVVQDGRLLILHRRKRGDVYDAIPGGKIEDGETPAQAAIREIEEETSLRVRLSAPVLVLENEGRREFYFDARKITGEPVLGGSEAAFSSPANAYALGWLALTDLKHAPIRPPALKEWLVARNWDEYPKES
jgi:8-oxo-dGTP pyrophosphatase MutT (NUDIX family)